MQERPTTFRRLLLFAAALFVGAIGWFLLGEPEAVIAEEERGQKVLARVNGVAITEKEVLEAIEGDLLKLDVQRYNLIQGSLHGRKREILLEQAALKAGRSVDEYRQAEIEAKAQDIPQEEVSSWYEARKRRLGGQPLAKLEPQIRQLLAQEALFRKLEENADVEVLLDPYRMEVAATGPAKGPDGAPVTIIEFSDFECPFCGRVNPSLRQVEEKYGDKVRIVFRQFPLDMHPNARKAAEASLCAADQKTEYFWQLHDAMFADQKNLGVDGLKAKAAAVDGLDTAAFDECLDSGRHAATVERDLEAGAKVGVTGTPAFFVNGRFFSGALDFEAFAAVIDDELERAGGQG